MALTRFGVIFQRLGALSCNLSLNVIAGDKAIQFD